jgi:hypothetical protein
MYLKKIQQEIISFFASIKPELTIKAIIEIDSYPSMETPLSPPSAKHQIMSSSALREPFSLLQGEENHIKGLYSEAFIRFLTQIPFYKNPPHHQHLSLLYYLAFHSHQMKKDILSELIQHVILNDIPLITHPEFLDAFLAIPSSRPDERYSVMHLMIAKNSNHQALRLMLDHQPFHAQLLHHDQFIPALLERCPQGAHVNKSALFWLTKCNLIYLLSEWLASPAFVARLIKHTNFLPTFLAFNDHEPDAGWSILYLLTYNSLGISILKILLSYPELSNALTESHEFQVTLLTSIQNGPHENISAFFQLCLTMEGNQMLEHLFKSPTFKNALLSEPKFITTLLAHKSSGIEINISPLYLLAESTNSHTLIEQLFSNDQFIKNLLNHPSFIPTLLALIQKEPCTNMSILTWLLYKALTFQPLYYFFKDDSVINKLISHREFFSTLLTTDTSTNHISGLNFLSSEVMGQLLFEKWLLHPIFISLLSQSSELLDKFCQRFLNNAQTSIFSNFLSTSKGLAIIRSLFNYQAFKESIFKQLGLLSTFSFDWLIQNEAGFTLLQQLIKHHQLKLLDRCQDSIFKLFHLPQIQQLIHLGLINPHLFLFIAVVKSEEDFILLLKEPILSPWEVTPKGLSLNDLIKTNLLLPEAIKHRQEAQLVKAQELYAKTASDRCLLVHLNHLGSHQTLYKENQTSPDLPTLIATPSIATDEVDETIIQEFNQHVQWIINEKILENYHPAFIALSENRTIQNPVDYPIVLNQLRSICRLINYKLINKEPLPSVYTEWTDSLGTCVNGVLNTFGEMFIALSNQSALFAYIQQVETDTQARYNHLFGTESIFEVHIPKQAIQAEMGIYSKYEQRDPYLQKWTLEQRRWCAQSQILSLCQKEAIVRLLTEPLEINIDAYIQPTTHVKRRKTDKICTITPKLLSYLQDKFIDYNRSPIFEEPLDFHHFMAFISALSPETDAFETSLSLREDLHEILIRKTSDYLQAINIFHAPDHVQTKMALIIHFLTTPLGEIQAKNLQDSVSLITECALATDGAAFIQQAIEQLHHRAEITNILTENLFYETANNPSIFSILISNPFNMEWLFGYNVSHNKEESEFKFINEAPHFPELRDALLASKQLPIQVARLLNQPGALLFALCYAHHTLFHKPLFDVVLSFLNQSPKGIYMYHHLGAVLCDMQADPLIPTPEKDCVTSFLYDILNIQLENKDEHWWQTVCYLRSFTPEPNLLPILVENPWLLKAIDNPRHKQALCLLINDNEALEANIAKLKKDEVNRTQHQPTNTSINVQGYFFQAPKKVTINTINAEEDSFIKKLDGDCGHYHQ